MSYTIEITITEHDTNSTTIRSRSVTDREDWAWMLYELVCAVRGAGFSVSSDDVHYKDKDLLEIAHG